MQNPNQNTKSSKAWGTVTGTKSHFVYAGALCYQGEVPKEEPGQQGRQSEKTRQTQEEQASQGNRK